MLFHCIYRRLLRTTRAFRSIDRPLSPAFRAANKLADVVRYQFRHADDVTPINTNTASTDHPHVISAVRALALLQHAIAHDGVERRIVISLCETDVWRRFCARSPLRALSTADDNVVSARALLDGAITDIWCAFFRENGVRIQLRREPLRNARNRRNVLHARGFATAASDNGLYRSPMREYRSLDLPPLVIEPRRHRGTLIWLHGISETNGALSPLFQALPLAEIKVLVPSAPLIPITAENEREQRAWFDVVTYDLSGAMQEDTDGIDRTANALHRTFDAESALIGSRNLFIGGFAHGAAMALHAALSYQQPLGGVVAISGFVPAPSRYPSAIAPANEKLKVLCVNGQRDHIVPIALATERYKQLARTGVQVEVRSDAAMDHQIPMQRMIEAIQWITRQMKTQHTART